VTKSVSAMEPFPQWAKNGELPENRSWQNRHGGHLQPDVSPLLGKMPGKPEARQGIRPELSLYGDERLTELIRRAWPRCLTWPWVVVQE
jgi:hypothetical protein